MHDARIVSGGVTLAVIAALCAALVAATFLLTKERIAANEQAWLERNLQPVLAGLSFDSGITDSPLVIPAPNALPGSGDATVYRVYAAGVPAAALFVVTARDGYSGPIRLLIGIDAMGAVTGVHVLQHRETPGLGDQVESGKSDWVRQFVGRSLSNPGPEGWDIKRDGGVFDQLTGASVTPRAIVNAVRETLLYFSENTGLVFLAGEPAETAQGDAK